MWPRRLASALLACCAVILLGTASAWAVAPTPAPGASPGSTVTAWSCRPLTSPAPTTYPSPDVSPADPAPVPTVVPAPTTTPVPAGEDCAATDYGPGAPSGTSSSPASSSSWPSCVSASDSASPLPSPSTSPSASTYSAKTLGVDCPLSVEASAGQAFGLWLFLGSLLTLAVFAVLLKVGRGFRG